MPQCLNICFGLSLNYKTAVIKLKQFEGIRISSLKPFYGPIMALFWTCGRKGLSSFLLSTHQLGYKVLFQSSFVIF